MSHERRLTDEEMARVIEWAREADDSKWFRNNLEDVATWPLVGRLAAAVLDFAAPSDTSEGQALPPEKPPFKMPERSAEWWLERARQEGDATIGTGAPALPERADTEDEQAAKNWKREASALRRELDAARSNREPLYALYLHGADERWEPGITVESAAVREITQARARIEELERILEEERHSG